LRPAHSDNREAGRRGEESKAHHQGTKTRRRQDTKQEEGMRAKRRANAMLDSFSRRSCGAFLFFLVSSCLGGEPFLSPAPRLPVHFNLPRPPRRGRRRRPWPIPSPM